MKKGCVGPTTGLNILQKEKSFAPGKMQTLIIQLMAMSPYRLSCPNS
jgi:hypothetical protein